MKIVNNFSLINHNTFGVDAIANQFTSISSINELKKIISSNESKEKIFIGGGSNILITKKIEGLVIHLNIKGISSKKIDNNYTEVNIKAGENWNEAVIWCLKNDLGGIENLSLIPGNTGAAPIQNIGAYGVELKDVFTSCEVLNVNTNEIVEFSKVDCQFEYRNSIFKKNKNYIILSVKLKLTHANHKLKVDYGSINEKLISLGIVNPKINDIANIVTQIRKEKLPDPKKIGNSGSFFKNPIIKKKQLEKLKLNFKDIPNYKISDENYKIPAGWLIEKAGFKGKRIKDYGVHKNQALVLVNYGNATGKEILEFSLSIEKAIQFIFDIKLENEVNII
ncbi:MAG: UDP-N-acetylenolpyruvoylglucosamine reductase [Flavobacteriaceae bacterium]|nr:MAG: UDP-N-acetylenolpyruvoylglucosamine reductase [Flavobacteriaceae bacterium]|tara:strand:- start:1160 stop:2167 length:1008 start_codon:yes stop_codon:yes gene_type:complete